MEEHGTGVECEAKVRGMKDLQEIQSPSPRSLSEAASNITMATFQSVNVGRGLKDCPNEATTPTTPRAPISITFSTPPIPISSSQASAPTTPTASTAGGVDGQTAVSTASFASSFASELSNTTGRNADRLDRRSSHQSTQSTGSQDIEMDDENDEEGNSDAESIDAETGRPSKKKKGLRFFCTDYPPCSLSFTRSEHLARHIRYVEALATKGDGLTPLGNIPGNGLSSAIVPVGFRDSTTSGNTRKRCTSMRRYREILSRRPALDSNDRFGRIESGRQPEDHAPLPRVAKGATAEATAEIYPRRALVRRAQPLVEMTAGVGRHH